MKNFRILPVILMAFSTSPFALAQTWTPTGAPSDSWQGVASSADGSKLVAVAGYNLIYTSTNSGIAWASNNVSSPTKLVSVASSADGITLTAAGSEYIFVSTNAGTTWSSNFMTQSYFDSIACSADGSKMIAALYSSGQISYNSSDSGKTWRPTNFNGVAFNDVASSADGTRLVAVSSQGYIFISTNAGASWIRTSAPYSAWGTVASSADGKKLIAAISYSSGGPIYLSHDGGTTWSNCSAPQLAWRNVASSADGSKLAAITFSQIYTSTNSGLTWNLNTAPSNTYRFSIACSADGNKWFVAGYSGIYTAQTTPAPQFALAPSGSNLTLSWIIPSTNFGLQQSPDLRSWTDVTNPPALNLTNLHNEVMLSPIGSSGFYRLKTP